jgi:hypothetical protein
VEIEKLRTRLKEKFTQYRDALRSAVYRLLGWKVDLSLAAAGGGAKVILRSMFAESEAHYLEFRLGADDDEPQVMASPFLDTLAPETAAYLDVYHSHPGFTAAITHALFEQSTLVAPGAAGGGRGGGAAGDAPNG